MQQLGDKQLHHHQPQHQRPPRSLDSRAGRFASALLLLAALVLAVDVAKAGLFAWYSDGSYLRFSLGPSDRGGGALGDSVRWPRCRDDDDAAASLSSATSSESPPPADRQQQQQRRRQRRAGDATNAVSAGLYVAGHFLPIGGGGGGGFDRPPPRPLVRVLCHASSAACLLMLLAAALPVRLRLRRRSRRLRGGGDDNSQDDDEDEDVVSGCSVAASLTAAAPASVLSLAAISACIVKVYLLGLCEVSQSARAAYAAFVPTCPNLRKAAFCAECFSLLLLTAAACMNLCVAAFYSRALRARGRQVVAAAAAAATTNSTTAPALELQQQQLLTPLDQTAVATTIVRDGSCGSCVYSQQHHQQLHQQQQQLHQRTNSQTAIPGCNYSATGCTPSEEPEYYLTYR